jgi:hypothetical protein
MTRWLIGLDDTDNLESRGTGHLARRMAEMLTQSGVAIEVKGITRHQLLVDARIPYTSHNSSACIVAEFEACDEPRVVALAAEFLFHESAPGSDAGLCVACWAAVTGAIQAFGQLAKRDVVTMPQARHLADAAGIYLVGLTGTHGGVIGSLAAVGLHVAGNDGRFLWLRGLRELAGIYSVEQLQGLVEFGSVQTETNEQMPALNETVDVGDWVRPILRHGQAVLLVERNADEQQHSHWRVVARERIKQLSD